MKNRNTKVITNYTNKEGKIEPVLYFNMYKDIHNKILR